MDDLSMTQEILPSPKRCFGNKPNQTLYADYHDNEWGTPCYDDKILFEFLILEGAQAGLNWETILKKRDGYRKAFHNFDVQKVANMSDEDLTALVNDDRIIRNRLKIFSVRKNAISFINIQKEFGSFSNYLWNFVDQNPIHNHFDHIEDVPTQTDVSQFLSKDLKKRGMSFVGPTIMYAYMQAIGMVSDHLTWCWKYKASPEKVT